MTTERDHIDRELREEGSTLPELLRRDTMRVPDGYFEQLEASILKQTTGPNNNRSNRVMLQWTAIAAAAVILLCIGIRYLGPDKTSVPLTVALAAMDEEDLEAYIDKQVAAISYDEFLVYLNSHVQSFESADLFTTQLIDATELNTTIHEELHNQVFSGSSNGNEKILEDHFLDEIDESTIQEFLNSEALFDDWAL